MERQQEITQQREKLQALVKQAKTDTTVKDTLRQDPIGVLQQAGLTEHAIGDFLREEGYSKASVDSLKMSAEGKANFSRIIPNTRCWDECCFTCMCTGCCVPRI